MSQLSLVAIVIVLVVSLSSCSRAETRPADGSASDNTANSKAALAPLRLPITQVGVETLTDKLLLPGVVFALPDHSIKVSPGIAGKLIDVKVAPGQTVSKGQVIALLDNRQLLDQLNQAHAKRLVAEAGVQQAKTNLLLAQNTFERNARLVQQEIGAEKDLVAAKSQVETANAQLIGAKAQVNDAAAAEAAASAQLTYTTVKSPIKGVVAQRFLNISDSADTATAIAQVVELSKVIVEASLPATQPASITPGQVARITAKSLPDRYLEGVVQSINPVTDNQGTTIGVRILCPNPRYELKEGMPVTAAVVMSVHPHALTVPLGAIVADPSSPTSKMVYLFKDGKISRVRVTVGIQNKSHVEVLSGLKQGESIVASGGYGIPDGTEVEALGEPLHANPKVTSKSN